MIWNVLVFVLSFGNDFDIFYILGKAFDSINGIKSFEVNTVFKWGYRVIFVVNKLVIVVLILVKICNLWMFMFWMMFMWSLGIRIDAVESSFSFWISRLFNVVCMMDDFKIL